MISQNEKLENMQKMVNVEQNIGKEMFGTALKLLFDRLKRVLMEKMQVLYISANIFVL